MKRVHHQENLILAKRKLHLVIYIWLNREYNFEGGRLSREDELERRI